jgi:hypothetical protein
MSTLKKALTTFTTALLFTLAALDVVTATSVIIPSDDEMITGARAIVRGTVTGVSSHYDEPHRAIFTYITLQVSEVFKGQITTSEVVLKEPGGITPEAASIIFGTPEFQPGEDVLLYLDTWPDGSLRVHQWFLGKYLISAGLSPGEQLVTRALGGEKISILGQAKGKITNRAGLENYLAMVRTRVAALREASAQHEAKYFSDVAVQAMPIERLNQTGGIEHFTLFNSSYPVRWFEPDAGLPVTFKINLAGAPSAGSTDDIVAAMNAWSSVSGSALRVVNGGATNGCGLLTTDGENTISFNNCDGYSAFSPGVGCSGVLGAAGIIRFSFGTRTVNGTNFYQALEGNIAFSPYATCHLSNSCKAREIATHEMGHALGFGHSQDASATMSAVTHFDGRCAGLRADDEQGVRFIYPGTGVAAPPPLTISLAALPNARVGEYYWLSLGATGGTPPYSWSAVESTLPAGLRVDAFGLINGTPTAGGTFNVSLRVTDSVGASAQTNLPLTVAGAPAPPAPTPLNITTTTLPNAQVGTAYAQTLNATGGTTPYQWRLAEGALPPGLSLNAGINGMPSNSGAFNFTMIVTDAAGQTAQTRLLLTVIDAPAPPPPPPPSTLLIITGGLGNAQVGVAYSQALNATGGTPPYVWSLADGSLPTGLGLNAAGLISGAPTASGAFYFTARVVDAGGQIAQINLSLLVADAPLPPPPPPPAAALIITTRSLPNALTNSPYFHQLGATGGTAPYTWSWSEGAFFFGLSLSPDGVISGLPSVSGSYSFIVRVVDAAGVSTRATLTLNFLAGAAPTDPFSSRKQFPSSLGKRR